MVSGVSGGREAHFSLNVFFLLFTDLPWADVSFITIKIKKQHWPARMCVDYGPGLLYALPHLILPVTLTQLFYVSPLYRWRNGGLKTHSRTHIHRPHRHLKGIKLYDRNKNGVRSWITTQRQGRNALAIRQRACQVDAGQAWTLSQAEIEARLQSRNPLIFTSPFYSFHFQPSC